MQISRQIEHGHHDYTVDIGDVGDTMTQNAGHWLSWKWNVDWKINEENGNYWIWFRNKENRIDTNEWSECKEVLFYMKLFDKLILKMIALIKML